MITVQRKTLGPLQFKAGSQEGAFRATIATLAPAVDSDLDTTLPGAFEQGAKVLISAFGHSSWNGALPVGSGVIGADQKTAWVDGRFFVDSQPGRDTYLTVKHLGALQQWSYGYKVEQASFDPAQLAKYPGAARILQRLTVFEASPVLVGAGVGTQTEFVKGPISARGQHAGMDLEQIQLQQLRRDFELTSVKLGDVDNVDFAEIPDAFVNPVLKQLAKETQQGVYNELRMKIGRIRWFLPKSMAGELAGETFRDHAQLVGQARRPSEIWIRASLSPAEVVRVVAHELRHIHQAGRIDEADAEHYGRQFQRNFLESRSSN